MDQAIASLNQAKLGIERKIEGLKNGTMHVCDYCGKVSEDVSYEADPYALEIHDDDTPAWICNECHKISTEDI